MRKPKPPQLGDVFTRREALAVGLSRHEIEWALRSGRWLTLRRGVYCLRETYDAADVTARHLLLCQAALAVHDSRHILSHLSAALSFGWPAPLGDLGPPSLTIGGSPASTDRQDDLVVQVAGLRPHELGAWREWRRTSPARTVADCLRHLTVAQAVPLADAAIHEGRTDLPAIEETLARQHGWPYVTRGMSAVALVDGRRESWLESFSFVSLHGEGIALPVPQVEVYDSAGDFVARVDGLWPDHATVAEADGRAKYSMAGLADTAGADSTDLVEARIEHHRRALVREKVREDRLRAEGLEVVRWGTHDVVHGLRQLAGTIRRTWSRGDPRRFTGSIVVPPVAAWPGDASLAVESG